MNSPTLLQHLRLPMLLLVCSALWACAATPPLQPPFTGHPRFQVLSPTLIRLEMAEDGHFEDSASINVVNRAVHAAFTTASVNGWTEIKTEKILLRYRENSGQFAADNVTLQSLGGGKMSAPIAVFDPAAATPGANLGGWYRSLDGASAPVQLHDGLLSRDGWYLLDDTQTALWTATGWARPREQPAGYQDRYLFAYGHDYATGLADFAKLTGPAPLLPKWAFRLWYSRWFAYSATDYTQDLLPKFAAEKLALDVLVVDTDWKAPDAFVGWQWNTTLFPDPKGFLAAAHAQGLHVSLNIHPAILGDDVHFAATNAKAGGLLAGEPNVFNWDFADPKHVASYFALHDPLENDGVDLWWLDWCCNGSRVSMAGLTPDTWLNYLYSKRISDRGLRGFAFSRIGSVFNGYSDIGATTPAGPWADHRYSVHFTGDTSPTWEMLNFETYFTIREGNIGLPYVSHDIGSFAANHLADDMYVRWVQLAAFQPIMRLHSNHGDRLPWQYGDEARDAAEKFLRLREQLVPYFYTLARQSVDTGLPMVRGMYLQYPDDDNAYTFDHQFLLGNELLVAPIATAGKTATVNVWLPPGKWLNIFSGQVLKGPKIQTMAADFSTMPVFARAGTILPLQPPGLQAQTTLSSVLLKVFTGADGFFELYDDDGVSLGYQIGQSTVTKLTYSEGPNQKSLTCAVFYRSGGGPGPTFVGDWQRTYTIEFIDIEAPKLVKLDEKALVPAGKLGEVGWLYDAATRTLLVELGKRATNLPIALTVE